MRNRLAISSLTGASSSPAGCLTDVAPLGAEIESNPFVWQVTNPCRTRQAAPAGTLGGWERKFRAFQFRTFLEDDHVLPYRFYQPPVLKNRKVYPLVLVMHGARDRGTDNRRQLRSLRGTTFWEKHPCLVLVPQCPKLAPGKNDEQMAWNHADFGHLSHTQKEKTPRSIQAVIGLITKTVSEKPVDRRHIYIMGVCMGDFATWKLFERGCGKFAAGMPILGSVDLVLTGRKA